MLPCELEERESGHTWQLAMRPGAEGEGGELAGGEGGEGGEGGMLGEGRRYAPGGLGCVGGRPLGEGGGLGGALGGAFGEFGGDLPSGDAGEIHRDDDVGDSGLEDDEISGDR